MNKLYALPLIALSLNGCTALAGALGMGAAGTVLGGLNTLNNLATVPPATLQQEFTDVLATISLVHDFEMKAAAMGQSSVVAMIPQPVIITPGTPMTPVTVTPLPPIHPPIVQPTPVTPK